MFEKQEEVNNAIDLEEVTPINDPEVPPISDEEDTGFEHTITQEDLDLNPGLEEEVEVGDVVTIPAIDVNVKEVNGKMYRELKNSDGSTFLQLIQ